jgi:hypothetical protein
MKVVWVRVPPRPWFESYKKAELQSQFGFFIGPIEVLDRPGSNLDRRLILNYWGTPSQLLEIQRYFYDVLISSFRTKNNKREIIFVFEPLNGDTHSQSVV